MVSWIQQILWKGAYYGFLLLFAVGIYTVNLICLPVTTFLPRARARKILRWVVHRLFQVYIAPMKWTGNLYTNPEVLDGLGKTRSGLLIIANHPSILDAPLILSRIPGLLCVFKSALKKSFTMSRTARTLGYLSNDAGFDMLKDLARTLRAGERVLIFPEGTRTENGILNPLNSGYALAAMRARVPVQLVWIDCDTPLLSKRQHFLRSATFPVRFSFYLGPTIEPGDFQTVKQLNGFVENWFRKVIAAGQPVQRPSLPLSRISERDDTGLTVRFRVPTDPFYCRGHMPGHPLVPGYTQMAWVHEIIEEEMPGFDSVQFFRWKFLQPVLPESNVEIRIAEKPGHLDVRVSADGGRAAQGRVLLHAKGND